MVGVVNQTFKRNLTHYQLSCIMYVLFALSGRSAVQAQPPADDHLSIKGTPRVIHYTRKDFNSDPQIWAMCQDNDGILYFGSNSGALIYDGETWQNVKLPNQSSVRSLAVSKDGVVYAGGFNEFGTIKKDTFGKYHYESWVHLLRVEDRNIENIWAINEIQGHMIFRSYRLLIAIANNKAITFPASSAYRYSGVLHNELFVKDGDQVKRADLQSLEFTPVLGPEQLDGEAFLSLLPGYNDHEILVITKEGALFKVDLTSGRTSFLQRLIEINSSNRITSAIKSSTGNYYFGTLKSKVIALNSLGMQTATNEVFDKLQDNTVHSLFESHEGNIWVLLNNGIDCIDISSPVTRLFDNASILDALIGQGKLYLATSQGVIVSPLDARNSRVYKTNFKSVPGLEVPAWSLQQFEGHILCGNNDGLVVFPESGGYRKIPVGKGVWKTIAVQGKPGYYLVCTYEGLYLMQYNKAEGFKILHKLEGFDESSRDILQGDEPGVFWVCHGYKGVFRIKIDNAFKRVIGLEHFKDKNGLPSPFNINVFRWNGETVFTTNQGIFTYNATADRFEPHAFLNRALGTQMNIRKLLEVRDKTWFVQDDEVGYFTTKSENPVLTKGLFLQLKGTLNESMECILPVNNNNVLIGTREGLFSFDLAYNPSGNETKTVITGVSYKRESDEIPLALKTSEHSPQHLAYQTTSVRFGFSAPGFDDKMNIQYSYLLEGISENWSAWQDVPFQEYTGLRPGRYVFRVKARSLLGEKADEAAYHFQLMPIWYKTDLAYLGYALGSLLLIIFAARQIQRRIEHVKRKTIAEEEEKRKVLQLEIERIKLEREKEEIIKDKEILEEDVIFKSKELANYTMLLVKKRELLSELSDDLKNLKEAVSNDRARQTVRELQRKINQNLQSEEHLKVFEANFERVHSEFFSQLRSSFPDLTQKELQLCAFVKMNLTNKEIASILNLSVRGIETARYRLRKRLGISHEEDMADFLEKLYAANGEVPELIKNEKEPPGPAF